MHRQDGGATQTIALLWGKKLPKYNRIRIIRFRQLIFHEKKKKNITKQNFRHCTAKRFPKAG